MGDIRAVDVNTYESRIAIRLEGSNGSAHGVALDESGGGVFSCEISDIHQAKTTTIILPSPCFHYRSTLLFEVPG